MNRQPSKHVIRWISCIVFLSVGLLGLAFAGVGLYQLRVLASPDFRGDFNDYQIANFAAELLHDESQVAKPAELAAKIQSLFLVCGLAGIVWVLIGVVVIVMPRRKQ